jgi:hypothetical protein
VKIALYLLGVQGLIGAFDTIYYHEWKARLPARGRRAARELALHAARDFLYGVLFISLPRFAWKGKWIALLLGVIGAQIILTLWDFVVEIAVRRDLGDVYAGERVTHAIMGILYGAMLATPAPTLISWWASPTALNIALVPIPKWVRVALSAMGVGVVLSGLRDLYAALQLPGADGLGVWATSRRGTVGPASLEGFPLPVFLCIRAKRVIGWRPQFPALPTGENLSCTCIA